MNKTELQPIGNFYLNVELLAPHELREMVRMLQRRLNLHRNVDYLPGISGCPIHLTLYSTYSSMPAISNMMKVLKTISEKIKPVSIEIEEPDCFPDGSVVLSCYQAKPLILLHQEIVSRLNPLRDISEPPEDFAAELSKEQIERFRRIGDPFALESYRPHITIARVNSYQKARQLKQCLSIVPSKVPFSRLVARAWLSEDSAPFMLFEQILQ